MRNSITQKEAIEEIDKIITEIVYPKYNLQKAYNYYNGKRDAEQFKYLEENFGIGTPSSVKFTPLVRKHIDAIVGEYLETSVLPKITCKDPDTISAITREKDMKIASELHAFFKQKLQSAIMGMITDGKISVDPHIEDKMKKIVEDIDMEFISSYEIAAQTVVEYLLQSRHVDFVEKRRKLLLDLLITGWAFFRVSENLDKNNVDVEVLDPLNTFVERNPESQYIKDCPRSVVRKWLNKSQIIYKYGKYLSKDDIESLENSLAGVTDNNTYYIRSYEGTGETQGIDNKQVVPGFPDERTMKVNNLWPVYEVEWIEPDKNYVLQRYSGVRIGHEIYIVHGKDENVQRSQINPNWCGLTVNGIYFTSRDLEPYSLMLACADLQDQYDILFFYRDNLIANSGVSGDWVDLSLLPTIIGNDLWERLEKFIAYKKQGIAIMDSSQEGRTFNNNTTLAGYDDTLKAQSIQGVEMAIERVEATCSSITGVFRERLNGIQQKDAVSNVKLGVQNSFIITKQFTHQMDLMTVEILSDSLNCAKSVWKNGLVGALILGDKSQKVFQIAPENFVFSDFDIHITSGSEILKDMDMIKQIAGQFTQAGIAEPDLIVDVLSSKSMTDLQHKVKKSIKIKKAENNQLLQLQQQNEQLQQQMKEAEQQMKNLQKELEKNDSVKLEMEKQMFKAKNELDWFKAKSDKEFKEKSVENDSKRTEVEVLQMYDDNPYNNKIKNY